MVLTDRKLERLRKPRETKKNTCYGLEIRTELLLGRA
jgi:hypothetical protein